MHHYSLFVAYVLYDSYLFLSQSRDVFSLTHSKEEDPDTKRLKYNIVPPRFSLVVSSLDLKSHILCTVPIYTHRTG